MTFHTPAIEAYGLTKKFGNITAVNNLDLTIDPGEIVAVLGRNGAGKTTLIDMLLGYITPTTGKAMVLGHQPGAKANAGRIGVVAQTGGIIPTITVIEAVSLCAAAHGVSQQAIDEAITRADLQPVLKRRVKACSGGEQQRLKFALSLLSHPDLIIVDEPTAGMDLHARRRFWQAISEDAHRGRTIVFATHYLAEVETVAQRVVIMREGKIVADDTTEQFIHSAQRTITAQGIPADYAEKILADLQGTYLGDGVFKVSAADSDAAVKKILAHRGYDLLIQPASLEDVFVELTGFEENNL